MSISPVTPQPQSNLLVSIIARVLVNRIAKNYVTTVIGVLVGIGGSIASFTSVIPPKYQAGAAGVAALCGAVALALAKDSSK